METESHKHMLAIDMRINTHTVHSVETQLAQIHKSHGLLFCMEVNMQCKDCSHINTTNSINSTSITSLMLPSLYIASVLL